jgi:alpha-mannosidase
MKAFNRRNEQLADAAGWREGRVPARAARLNQPLVAFQAQAHPGALGRSLGLIDVSDTHDQIAVRAFKKAEDSEELIVRVQELYGRPVSGVQVSLPTGILNAREVNAAEEPVGEARVAGGKLTFNLTAYQPRTFAVTPDAPAARVAAVASSPLDLPFNLDGISTEANRADGDFDGRGRTYPAEQLPRTFSAGAVAFRFGPVAAAAPNAVAARGQRIALPAGTFNRVYILASSVGGDQKSMVTIERRRAAAARVPLNVQEWTGAIGQWDSRLRDDRLLREVFIPKMNDDQSWPLETIESQMLTKWIAPPKPAVGATAASPAAAAAPAKATPLSSPAGVSGLNLVRPGFVKRDEVAWVATHRHSPEGDEPYIFGYVFRYAIDLPQGATAIVLPLNDRIRVFAMTAANEPTPPVRAATVLYAPDLGAVPTARR